MQLIKIIENVIADVLTAIYQPFWPSTVLSVLGMFAYLLIIDKTVACCSFSVLFDKDS